MPKNLGTAQEVSFSADPVENPPLPPPWSIEELDACFVVTDSAGQKLAYVYFEDEPGRPGTLQPHGLPRSKKFGHGFFFLVNLVKF
jgi:hypothetical protein